jgi:hypothetical protein
MRADEVLACLRNTTQDDALKALLGQLGLDAKNLKMKGGKGDLVSTTHGITLIFHQAAADAAAGAAKPRKTGQLTDVQFTARGYQGGPPFSGELPRGVRFDMNRAQVHALIGPPVATAMLGIPNERWDHGADCYFTLDFVDDYSSIKKVTVGLRV